jgi:hypothetical protein
VRRFTSENFDLILCFRIVEYEFHHKPIKLSFREGIGSRLLDRILSSKYDKWTRKIERRLTDGDRSFLHSFEECGLDFWRSTIDLISKKYTRKYRTFSYTKFSLLWSVYFTSRKIRGEKIWSKRYPLKIQTEYFCYGLHRECFSESWDSLKKYMSSAEYHKEKLLDENILTDNTL